MLRGSPRSGPVRDTTPKTPGGPGAVGVAGGVDHANEAKGASGLFARHARITGDARWLWHRESRIGLESSVRAQAVWTWSAQLPEFVHNRPYGIDHQPPPRIPRHLNTETSMD